MGFNLKDIKDILNRPGFDREDTLKTHKELLVKKKERIEKMIDTVDKTLKSIKGVMEMSKKDMFEGFDMTEIEEHQKKYAKEAEEKYGDTYRESAEKTSKYDQNDWARISSKTDDIYKRIYDRMEFGPEDQQVQQAVGEWRKLITDNFYNCTIEIFRGLADMYVYDERFTKNINKHGEGLAEFLKDAMHIYCDNHSKQYYNI